MKLSPVPFLHVSSVAHFVGSDVSWVRFPRLGFAFAWGYHSVRQLRRLVEGFPLTYRSVRVETLSEKQELRTCYIEDTKTRCAANL